MISFICLEGTSIPPHRETLLSFIPASNSLSVSNSWESLWNDNAPLKGPQPSLIRPSETADCISNQIFVCTQRTWLSWQLHTSLTKPKLRTSYIVISTGIDVCFFSGGHYQAGVVTTVALTLLLVLSCFVWFGYAYFFPHTWSGQLLIKYRPSHWQWRRAEPRYTAASIHM